MKSLKLYMAEAAKEIPTTVAAPSKLGHLDHIEDRLLQAGDEGYNHARNTLLGMHDSLQGKPSDVKIGEKFDGAPSLVWGTNPENGKFFVATKSWGNKTPKINYTPEDIERNHGHAPGLVEKLKAALEHLPKVSPKGRVYQGDVMYTNNDINDEGKNLSFTPNTLTYRLKKNSAEGKKAAAAKLGVAVHTSYEDDGSRTLGGMRPRFMPDMKPFAQHPDVHIISTETKPNPENYTDEQKAEFQKHLDAADKAYAGLSPEAHEVSSRHLPDMMAYINHEVRQAGAPSHEGFTNFVQQRGQNEISKVKSPAAIERKSSLLNTRMNDIAKNKEHISKLLEVHRNLQNAKNVLVDAAAQNKKYDTSIGENPTGPEGMVAVNPNTNTIDKAVNRAEFSAANFAKNRGGGFTSEKP